MEPQEQISNIKNLPTITIAIIGHGEDLIHTQLPNIDHNVRIFSRAGQPLCLGINDRNMLQFLEELYLSDEREENKNTPSSYEMLLKVAEHYKEPEQEKDFKNMLDFELLTEWQKPILNKSLKHTIKTIRKKNIIKYTRLIMTIYIILRIILLL